MKKKISLILVAGMVAASLAGCGSDGKDNKATTENAEKKSSAASSLFSGELEKNVTIQVLENDTAISKGYFQELIDAFNEKYKDYGITAVDANMNQYLDLAV